MITEHYSTDVPRYTRIIDPTKHAGKLIVDVRVNTPEHGTTTFITDTGEKIQRRNHLTIRVEHGPERQAKVNWAREILDKDAS